MVFLLEGKGGSTPRPSGSGRRKGLESPLRFGIGTISIAPLRGRTKSYYQSMGLKFRYGFGKVLDTQNNPTCGLTSSYYVLHLNLIKGILNFAFYTYTHTHTNIHLTINMASIIPKP